MHFKGFLNRRLNLANNVHVTKKQLFSNSKPVVMWFANDSSLVPAGFFFRRCKEESSFIFQLELTDLQLICEVNITLFT